MRQLSQQIEDAAAEWVDALHQGGADPELRRAFERWRASDPAHAAAFARIDRAYAYTRGLDGSFARAILERETLARVAQRRERRRRFRYAALAASLVAAVAIGWNLDAGTWDELNFQQQRLRHAMAGESLHRTVVGERQIIPLADGSTLTLNTASRALVRYSDQLREIELIEGQALFEVARDTGRPFMVQAGDRRITALGTAFDVRLSSSTVAVTLIEGRVTVESTAAGNGVTAQQREAPPAILLPGEQLLAQAATRTPPVVRKADVRRATSWREGMLLFEGETLAQAIAEVNRYGGRRIEIGDPALADLQISGAFKTGQPEAFIDTLSWYLPIRVIEADGRRIILGQRA